MGDPEKEQEDEMSKTSQAINPTTRRWTVDKSKRTIIEEVAQVLEDEVERLRGVRHASPDSPWEWTIPPNGSRTYESLLAEADTLTAVAQRLRKAARFTPSLPHPPSGYEEHQQRRERSPEERREAEKSWREPCFWKEQMEMRERGELTIG
jgi:hypothetical protein